MELILGTIVIIIIGYQYLQLRYWRKKYQDTNQQNTWFQMIYEHAPIMIDSFKDDGTCVLWNRECEKQLGYSKQEIISHPNPLTLFYKDAAALEKVFRSIHLRAGKFEEFEVLLKNGEIRKQMWANFSLPNDNSTISFGYDITKLKLAEDALKQSEEIKQRVIEAIPCGIVHVKKDGSIILANQQALEFLGYSFNALTQLYVSNFAMETFWEDGTECPVSEYPVSKCLVTEEPQTATTIGVKHGGNSEVRWAVFSAIPIRDTQDKFSGVIVTFVDITDRKKAETERLELISQMRHAQKMEAIGTLAGGIAHDFNNILSSILGCIHVALAEPKKTQNNLQKAIELGKRAKDLVQQILIFGRRQEPNYENVEIQKLIEEVLQTIRNSFSVRTDIQCSLDPCVIFANPGQIHQILINLFTNASYAMRNTKKLLKISLQREIADSKLCSLYGLKRDKEYAHLVFSDTGCGIDPAIQDRIFEPFFTTKPLGEGTGMGLAIIHGIVKDHKGAISVDSKVNEGTTFHLFFPIVDNYQKVSPKVLPHQGKEHILFIDDEKILAETYKRLLEIQGYRVTIFTNALKALEKFKQQPNIYNLVLTDQNMPEMLGSELCERILEIRPEIPVVLLTGLFSPPLSANTKFSKIIEKPILPQELSQNIREVLDK